MFLEAHFGDVELHMPEEQDDDDEDQDEQNREPSLLVSLDEADARINLISMVSYRFIQPVHRLKLIGILDCGKPTRNTQKKG